MIDTHAALLALVESLQGVSQIALDTESNSMYAYRERVCLIQLSTRTADYVIDPLSIADIHPLGELTADPAIEIVLHDAEYDITCLKRDYDFSFAHLFDTMYAARILGIERHSLAALLASFLEIPISKKFQRANWGLRPLSPEMINYAQIDTHYLLTLRDLMYERLVQENAWEEAQEIFEYITHTPPFVHEFDTEGFWNMVNGQELNKVHLACLRELYLWRNKTAQQRDTPPFRVMSEQSLLALAQSDIYSMGDLYRSNILKQQEVRRLGRGVLQALARGRQAVPPQRPLPHRIPPEIMTRHQQLRLWRKRRAQRRGVPSDIILPRDALWNIAKEHPKTLEELRQVSRLGPWRLAQYGQEILEILAGD